MDGRADVGSNIVGLDVIRLNVIGLDVVGLNVVGFDVVGIFVGIREVTTLVSLVVVASDWNGILVGENVGSSVNSVGSVGTDFI